VACSYNNHKTLRCVKCCQERRKGKEKDKKMKKEIRIREGGGEANGRMKKGWKRRSKCGRKEDGQEMENEVTLFGDSTI